MQIRPHRIIKRKKTKKIKVGSVDVGGDSIISVQSMTNTLTTDHKATINQIKELEDMDKAGVSGFQITGKRAGGKVRGTGAAIRGFGKAGYSYKNM